MKRHIWLLLMTACIAFTDPGAVTFFLEYTLPPPHKYQIVMKDGQYQIFYEYHDEPVPIWICPPNADCAFVPQVCK